MTQKAKGPAEAATSKPGDVHLTHQGKKNMDTNSTEAVQAASEERSFRTRIMDLEFPIRDAKNMVSLLHRQFDDHFTRSHEALTKNRNHWYLSPEDVDDLIFTANMIGKFVRQTVEEWESALEVME